MSNTCAGSGNGARPRVFIVEDMPDTRDSLALLLAYAGYQLAGHADTEADAKQWLDANPEDWNLAVVDLVLLQGSGLAVICKCSRMDGARPVLVYTAYASQQMRDTCKRLGAAEVFSKLEGPQLMAYARALAEADWRGALDA